MDIIHSNAISRVASKGLLCGDENNKSSLLEGVTLERLFIRGWLECRAGIDAMPKTMFLGGGSTLRRKETDRVAIRTASYTRENKEIYYTWLYNISR